MSYASASGWNNPPPPGTLDDKTHGKSMKENYRRYSRSRSRSRSSEASQSYSRSRSRSRSRKRDSARYRRRRRSKSKSKRRHRKSRRHSRSRSHSRKRHHSRSRPRHHRRSYTRSRSRSKFSRSRSKSWSSSSYSDRESSYRNKKYVPEVPKNQEYIRKAYSKHNEVTSQENSFKNDGSFLEMFKKLQEEKEKDDKKPETAEAGGSEVKKNLPIFGKRRGGKVLKTGLVEKLKNPNDIEEEPKDAWSVYMKEVKRYKEACCDDDSKTRPLVK